jgi:hypothetical protein
LPGGAQLRLGVKKLTHRTAACRSMTVYGGCLRFDFAAVRLIALDARCAAADFRQPRPKG